MLKNSFLHMRGFGTRAEKRLWEAGILNWDQALSSPELPLGPAKRIQLGHRIRESEFHLRNRHVRYFARRIPAEEEWRMFPEFLDTVAYLDIETTGLAPPNDSITTIVLYDGKTVRHYVHGQNLQDFVRDVQPYELLVTYNGKQFDIPFIRDFFKISLDKAQIDLRFALADLGYKGGLKGCEKQLGIDPQDLVELDGYFAVLLWREYRRHKNDEALETLLAYNAMDVVNLEALAHLTYNMKILTTPFAETHRLAVPVPPQIPFRPHLPTIEKLRPRWERVRGAEKRSRRPEEMPGAPVPQIPLTGAGPQAAEESQNGV